MLGDAIRLFQIVTNLIGNAIKFTRTDGDIRVEVERQGDDAVLTVRDYGAGIAPHFLPRIFDLFMQAERTADSGLGIGLALSKKLTELHHGVIEAQSAGLGTGSTFIVRLPLAAALPAGRADTPASSDPHVDKRPGAGDRR